MDSISSVGSALTSSVGSASEPLGIFGLKAANAAAGNENLQLIQSVTGAGRNVNLLA